MGRIVGEGNHLSKRRLYGNFVFDLLLYSAETLGLAVGLALGIALYAVNPMMMVVCPLIALGVGILLKTLVMFPNYEQAEPLDVLTLMSDPYASPLRGQPAKLQGELIGRGDAGYTFGSDLKLQDATGMIYLRYASRFGPSGNFLFGMKRVKSLVGIHVSALGWFRRGVAPWMDLIQLETDSGTTVNSYHRFWSFVMGIGTIAIGIALLFVSFPA
jgi:hypothetical protein